MKDQVLARMGEHRARAEQMFSDYGTNLEGDVANVLLHAADQGKVPMVLDLLAAHYQKDLQFQHPVIRGTVLDDLQVNRTQVMFLDICKDVLGLQPNPA